MPPPTPDTCWAQPPHTLHQDWDGPCPMGHIIHPSSGTWKESPSPLSGGSGSQHALQSPRRCRDVSPHAAQAGGFPWLCAQAHCVALAWPRSAQGPLATGLVCCGCWRTAAELLREEQPLPSTGITAQCTSSWRNGAFSHNQPSLGHHQLGVIIRFQHVQPRQGVVPALLTYRPEGLGCSHARVSPSSMSHRCSVGSAQSRSCRPSPRVPSASPPHHHPLKLGANTPSPVLCGSGTSRSLRSWVMAPLVSCVAASGARLLARR